MPRRPSVRFQVENVSDLTNLPELTEESVLEVLQDRYQGDQIYTRCGDVLLSVNPFKPLKIYDQQHHDKYAVDSLRKDMDPHVFQVAAHAFKRLKESNRNQVVLVSGESGAGKTENTKYMLQHLMQMCGDTQGNLHDKILQVNPLLEAFGNAKTVLNDNSSRFAKYLQLNFSKHGDIHGATIKDYMLEKSRVVHQGRGEGNFHIFYSFLAGLSDEDRDTFSIRQQERFRIVDLSEKTLSWEDADMFRKYFDILTTIGITEEEMENVKGILATILHLTNIELMEDRDNAEVQVWDEVPLNLVVDLLEVNAEALATALVTKKIKVNGEEINTVRSKKSAEGVRDALAKSLYERLFGWIVRKINESLHPVYDTVYDSDSTIGILDICGFECLQENSFEQMCINLVNEKIQGYMNQQIFKREREIYEDEGVELICGDVDYNNNDDIIAVFMDRGMVLTLIDEDTRLEQASDKSLILKLGQRFATSDVFKKLPGDGLSFRIRHFAGEVTYDAKGFLEKNRDTLSQELVGCMKESGNVMVADLFIVNKGDTGTISVTPYDYRASRKRPSVRRTPKPTFNLTSSIVTGLRDTLKKRFGELKDGREELPKQTQTVVEYFRNSLKDLISQMDNSDAVFVRCIKPNLRLAPNMFEEKLIAKQLRYNGIAEVARIRKKGWPVRRSYHEVLTRFKKLTDTNLSGGEVSSKEGAARIIFTDAGLQQSNYAFGKTMIFMKEVALQKLEKKLREKEEEERKKAEEERKKAEKERINREAAEKRKKEEEAIRKMKPAKEAAEGCASSDGNSSGVASGSGSISSGASGNFDPPTTTNSIENSQFGETFPHQPSGTPRQQSGSSPSSGGDGGGGGGGGAGAGPSLKERRYENNVWDIFRVVDTEMGRKEAFNEMTLKVVKVIVYILLFLSFLVSCIGQRAGLMLLISNLPANRNETKMLKIGTQRYAHPPQFTQYLSLLIVICIPYILTSLLSFFKWLFGSYPTPGVLTWMVVLLIELLHSFGLSVLVFWVLPQYDIIHGALFLCATSILPSVLMITCTSPTVSGDTVAKGRLKKIVDFLAFLCQLSVVPIIVLLEYFKNMNFTSQVVVNAMDIAALIIGFLLASLKCWENFVDGNCQPLGIGGAPTLKNYNNAFMNKVLKIRFELQEGRYCVSMISGVLKIIVTCSVLYGVMFLRTEKINDIDEANKNVLKMFDNFATLYKEPVKFTLLLVVTICGFVAYYTSYIACKLQMQIMSLSIPLALSVPLTNGFLSLSCYYLEKEHSFLGFLSIHRACDTCEFRYCYSYSLGVVWFLSLLWITRHIWSPKQGRLEEFDRLFINPFYCGVLTQENILLNRRRHKEEVQYQVEDNGYKEHYFIVRAKRMDEVLARDREIDNSGNIPFIYACATMWHETRVEMTQLMKSLFRLDYDRHIREEAALILQNNDVQDRFNYQGHIFFDDALELNDEDKWQANQFVRTLISVMSDACSAVHQKYMQVHDPYKVKTPYGAQLIWEMPGGSLLYVHVKDKNKIRHRKRWSQVMYMYYLLGYTLLKDSSKDVLKEFNMRDELNKDDVRELFTLDVQKKTQNTYILALDGDTDFSPGSVRVLLDKMANEKVAAVCGRIHPIGSGPLVWYQMFEYAVGHWLQKATEHVLGCVLCSPGCFSLFRAAALMDNNIMKKYTTFPTEPGHFLQYDQGEDRWLCTLLLQQGYRVDYAAAADAYTYAPEGFNEFFNQRRRWTPSTLANILDLLSSSDVTVARNSNISFLYIFYQIAMMFGTVLGPGTVIMMIAGAIGVVFDLTVLWSYAISLGIPAVYLIVCFTTPTNIQLIVAAVLSALYSFVMMAVIAGTVITATTVGPEHPSVIFTCLLFFMFFFAGVLHWKEINCLPHCFLYFLCIPSGYLLLFIYSLANLNNVSWGTRELPKRKSKKELAREKKEAEAKKNEQKKKDGFFARMFFSSSYVKELKSMFESIKPRLLNERGKENDEMLALLKQMNANISLLAGTSTQPPPQEVNRDTAQSAESTVEVPPQAEPEDSSSDEEEEEEEIDPYSGKHWVDDPALGQGPVMEICAEESEFWEMFIKKYLKPIDKDEQKEKNIKAGLIELRNSVCFAIVMVNCLWIAVNFMFQVKEAAAITLYRKGDNSALKTSILGLMFIIFFTILIVIQFFGMLIHRWETLLHLISMTNLRKVETEKSKASSEKERVIHRLMGVIEPEPDYDDDSDIHERIKGVVKDGQTARELAVSRRQNFLRASTHINNAFPNLKSTLIGNGSWRRKPRRQLTFPNNVNNDAPLGEREEAEKGLRRRFYQPAVKNLVQQAREMGRLRESTLPEIDPNDDTEYAEIRNVMPGRMGRDFARKIKNLRETERQRRDPWNGLQPCNNLTGNHNRDFMMEMNSTQF